MYTDPDRESSRGRTVAAINRLVVAFALAAATAAATAGVILEPFIGECLDGTTFFDDTTTSGSTTTTTTRRTGGRCTLSGVVSSGPGKLQASAETFVNAGWFSGSGRVKVSGAFAETLLAGLDEDFIPPGLLGPGDKVLVRPRFHITYEVSSSATPQSIGSAYAVVDWSAQFNSHSLSGSQGSVNGVTSGLAAPGDVQFQDMILTFGQSYYLSLSVNLDAGWSKMYVPSIDPFIARSKADFCCTLAWMGLEVIGAMTAQGDPVPLPTNFRFSLIGQQSGFDYFNAVDSERVPGSDVPEPATAALLALGAAGLYGARRRKARREARSS